MRGRDSSTTDATARRSRLPAWRGEAEDARLARTSLLFMSSREWEGNGVCHDARKDVKRQRESLFCYHRGGRYGQIA